MEDSNSTPSNAIPRSLYHPYCHRGETAQLSKLKRRYGRFKLRTWIFSIQWANRVGSPEHQAALASEIAPKQSGKLATDLNCLLYSFYLFLYPIPFVSCIIYIYLSYPLYPLITGEEISPCLGLLAVHGIPELERYTNSVFQIWYPKKLYDYQIVWNRK